MKTYQYIEREIERRLRRCAMCGNHFLAYPSNRKQCDDCKHPVNMKRVYHRLLSGKYLAISKRDDSRLLFQGRHVANIENGILLPPNTIPVADDPWQDAGDEHQERA